MDNVSDECLLNTDAGGNKILGSCKTPSHYETSKSWRIMQADQGNHEHRPMFAVNSAEVNKIYRITSELALFVEDTEDKTDFYNFDVHFLRYRAFVLQPGGVDDLSSSFDYDKVKITVVHLRDKAIEQRIALTRPGCGDGIRQTDDEVEITEECDDGNNIDGDGCDSQCKLEDPDGADCSFDDGIIPNGHTCTRWVCKTVFGALSECTEIICGNGKLDGNEQCDDGNRIAGDGCFNCMIEAGFDCGDDPFVCTAGEHADGTCSAKLSAGLTCTSRCGNGISDEQFGWDLATGAATSTVIYGEADEPCDFGTASLTNNTDGVTWLGCTDSCTVAPGWECEVTIHSVTSERLSKCT